MTNGGKDIKLGDDKRPVSIVPSQELLYNIFNGEVLTDSFGQPLFSDEEIVFVIDALSKNSTSITITDESEKFDKKVIISIGNTEVTYGNGQNNQLGINTSGLKIGDNLSGKYIPDGTSISRIDVGSVFLSNNTTNIGIVIEPDVQITRRSTSDVIFRPTIKVEEEFKDSTEVSTTLLGIPRAETQLSLFSDVASYGLDVDQWETVRFIANPSVESVEWLTRKNKIYGDRFRARLVEKTNESALKLEAFPTPYLFPFGPNFEKLNLFDEELFQNFLRFVQLGNQLYNFYNEFGTSLGYPSSWKNNFLPESAAKVQSGDVVYNEDLDFSFANIDDWTETWRDMRDTQLIDPVTNEPFTFVEASNLNTITPANSTNTRPGYRSNIKNYIILQSKKSYRYQPGRISGYTFGSSCSSEPVTGYVIEFGIFNDSDEYIFRVDRGDLNIVRRSTVPLSSDVLFRNALEPEDQKFVVSSDPYKPIALNEIVIPRDKFNGDPLNGNGPSGYQLQLPNVTMYKVEFGWYGAVGARFYAYIPSGAGEARWVSLHTLILENQLGQPCLKESSFKFKYQLNISDNSFIRQPVFLYKYGSSFYIDGGDEGNFETNTKTSELRSITNTSGPQSFFGLIPKSDILSSSGDSSPNNKIVLPKKLTVNSNSLIKVDIINCTGCPDGFGYTFGPGVATTESGRSLNIRFTGTKTIRALGDDYFYESDKGAKLIGKTLWDVNIEELREPVGAGGSFKSARLNRDVGGELVNDSGITTSIGISTDGSSGDYPYPVRISNYDGLFVSDYKITGSKVDIEFLNPVFRDNGTNAGNQVADFRLGFTNVEPDINRVDGDIFNVPGVGYTTILPEERYLFAENKGRGINLNANGIETGEINNIPYTPLEIDITTPEILNPGGGVCSRISMEVQPPIEISSVNYTNTNPETGDAGNFLEVIGRFPTLSLNEEGDDTGYDGGEVAVEDEDENVFDTGIRYVGVVKTFTPDPANPQEKNSYISISDDISLIAGLSQPYKLFITPLKITFSNGITTLDSKITIFNYNPFPLYFVAQLKDNSALNSISIKETIGLNQKVSSPIQVSSAYTRNLLLTNAEGNANLVGSSPPNFIDVERLSSLKIDTLNQQKLRIGNQTRIIDTFYVGENDSRTVDLSKVFGVDRYQIIRNRRSNEGIFVVAENISSNISADVQMSLNYTEQ